MSFLIGLIAAIFAANGVRAIMYVIAPTLGIVPLLQTPIGGIVQVALYSSITISCYIMVSQSRWMLGAFLVALAISAAARLLLQIDPLVGVVAMILYHHPWSPYILTSILTVMEVTVYSLFAHY